MGLGGMADIVFLLDASDSMKPCIEGVKAHIRRFLDVFNNDPNGAWDVRLDFVAHRDRLREERAAGIDKDFRERVTGAGGQYDDVDVRISLLWENRNDLDLHVVTPSGEEIYFRDKRSSCGGELDVDRNVHGETLRPVENIRWKRGAARAGTYEVFVNNFDYHEPTRKRSPFRAEVFNGGSTTVHEGRAARETGDRVSVCSFTYNPRAAPTDESNGSFEASSVFQSDLTSGLYAGGLGQFFTADASAFRNALSGIHAEGNEAPLVALDYALDFPWRDRGTCHRIVVLLTDEPLEGGNRVEESMRLAPALVKKIHALKVLPFLITPDSEGFEMVSAADRCDWIVVEGGDGLASIDFAKLLERIARTVTKSQTPLGSPPPSAPRALFGQDRWVARRP